MLLSSLSPDDPYWQELWNKRYHSYEIYTVYFLVALVVIYIALSILAKKNERLRKQIRLTRTIGIWLALIGWVIFVGLELSLIPLHI